MTVSRLSIVLLLTVAAISCTRNPSAVGNWLGQALPSKTPLRFAAEWIKNSESPTHFIEIHGAPQFSPNGKLMLIEFQTYDKQADSYTNYILISRRVGGSWTELERAPFSTEFNHTTPSFHPDGRRLFFASNRTDELESPRADKDIWVVTYSEDSWGEPTRLGPNINTTDGEAAARFTATGKMYFCRKFARDEGFGEVMVSREGPNGFGKPTRLPTINEASYEFPNVVDLEDRWIVFGSSRGLPDHPRSAGLYFSRHLENDLWSEPEMLPEEINAYGMAFSASVTPDRKQFFFLNRAGAKDDETLPDREPGVYWMAMDFIE